MKKALLLTGFVLTALLSASAALAATAPRPTITVTVKDEVLWVAADLDGAENNGDVELRLMAPKRSDAARSLFQTCRFSFSDAADYRCGVDVAAGSHALRREGAWVAKLVVGGDLVAKQKFSV